MLPEALLMLHAVEKFEHPETHPNAAENENHEIHNVPGMLDQLHNEADHPLAHKHPLFAHEHSAVNPDRPPLSAALEGAYLLISTPPVAPRAFLMSP